MNEITLILTSSVIAAILSAFVSALVSIKLKQMDYKNEYYKIIINKRLESYQFLENQIALLKGVALGNDKKPYHMIFSYGIDDFGKFQQNLMMAMSYSIWIEDSTIKVMEELNDVFFSIGEKIENFTQDQIIEIGKDYYDVIAELRATLDNCVRKDLFNLHKIKKHSLKEKNIYAKRTVWRK